MTSASEAKGKASTAIIMIMIIIMKIGLCPARDAGGTWQALVHECQWLPKYRFREKQSTVH
jgi:hypothetical protein